VERDGSRRGGSIHESPKKGAALRKKKIAAEKTRAKKGRAAGERWKVLSEHFEKLKFGSFTRRSGVKTMMEGIQLRGSQ